MAGGRPIRASVVIQNLGSSLKHQGTGLDVTVSRPTIPGQVDVPQEGQPASLQTKDWNLPVLFRVGLAVDALSMDQRRASLLGGFNQPPHTQRAVACRADF